MRTSAILCAAASFVASVATSAKPESKPNLVMILADDLGIECLSSYGATSNDTPNLDKLAAQGMRFTHCFSNPYCSPSRASLLSGRYYRVYNNLCLGCSVKLREGYYRTIENNVFIGPHPPERHMGFEDSSDIYRRNIYVNTKDGQAWSREWGTRDLSIEMDHNLYFNYSGAEPIFGDGTKP